MKEGKRVKHGPVTQDDFYEWMKLHDLDPKWTRSITLPRPGLAPMVKAEVMVPHPEHGGKFVDPETKDKVATTTVYRNLRAFP